MNNPISLDVPKKIQDAKRFDLLQTMLIACQRAWEEAIKPRIEKVRLGNIDVSALKKGIDFFTEADIESERVIREVFLHRYGGEDVRIYGEENETYLGNLEAEITIRIDPIDGTEAFKFGKAQWSIMIGAYTGRDASERQIASLVYWPEYYHQILFSLDEAGVFIGDTVNGSVIEMRTLEQQDQVGELIVGFHKHTDINERGRDDEMIRDLEEMGARVRSLTSAEVKEALETRGRRAMIIDGDFSEVDFISYSSLVRLGYRLYGWDGVERGVDDPSIANQKLLFVPPGKAAEIILDIVKKYPGART